MPSAHVPPPSGSSPAFAEWWADLAERPWAYDLFQALRHIELARPDLPRLGTALRPADEPVRVCQAAELTFATASIHALAPGVGGMPPRVIQNVFGLLGVNGALPIHLTELVRERSRNHDDHTMQAFIDLFTHRFALLFYRAWAQAQPVVGLDRDKRSDVSRWLGALFGLLEDSQARRDAAGDPAKLSFTGRLAHQTRDADGLLNWCRMQFAVPLRIGQWCGHWMPLEREDRTRMRRDVNAQLGRSATIGERMWDVQHKFRIEIGPLRIDAFRRFLPGGPDLERLRAMVRQWTGLEFAWDLRLVLDRRDVPAMRLSTASATPLARCSWLGQYRRQGDAGDLLMDVEAVLRPRRPARPTDPAGGMPAAGTPGAATGAAATLAQSLAAPAAGAASPTAVTEELQP